MINRQKLLEVLFENRKEVMRYEVIKRNISLDGFDRRVLVGVRRAGKSFLLFGHIQKLVENGVPLEQIVYINFEDERLANLQLEDLNTILEIQASINNSRPVLFLDEIQNIEHWELFVNRLLRQSIKLLITGSNANLLSGELATHLTGRYNSIELLPFSFSEYCEAKSISSNQFTTKSKALLKKHLTNIYYEVVSRKLLMEVPLKIMP